MRIWLLVALATVATAIEQDHFKVTAPAGWTALPEVANTLENGMLGETTALTGGAIAHGDARAGVFGAVMWMNATEKSAQVRPEVEGFADALKTTLTEGGFELQKFEKTETATRLSIVMAGKVKKDGTMMFGRAVGVVDKNGYLHGFVVQCVRQARVPKKAAEQCEGWVDSFAVTYTDAELRPLEKKTR
jgi:hypothetical protein